MVKLFLDGGEFMWPILAIFIVGLAFVIERFWTLTRASVNTRKFLGRIRIALEEGGIAAATEECEKTPGPVASIFHAGLSRADKGLDHVEKAITTAGSLEMIREAKRRGLAVSCEVTPHHFTLTDAAR